MIYFCARKYFCQETKWVLTRNGYGAYNAHSQKQELKMADKPVIRLLNSGLSEDDKGEIIAVGFLDVDSMQHLLVDCYQREFLGSVNGKGKGTKIYQAVDGGVRLPSVVIGMRGQKFSSRGDTMYLEDPCFIVDGLQRIFTIKQFAHTHLTKASGLRIGAEIRFNTTFETEKVLFHALNAFRTSMSGNVILRNKMDESKAIGLLHDLTFRHTRSPLFKKVQWNQRMSRGELFTAIALVRVVATLHSDNAGTLSASRGNVDYSASVLDKTLDRVGEQIFRDNVTTFFEVLNEAFDTSHIEFREKATVIKTNFLLTMAQMFAEHVNFWHGRRLVVASVFRKQLSKFPVNDQEVMRLSASGNMAIPLLYDILIRHMNKGKRVNKLVKKLKNK